MTAAKPKATKTPPASIFAIIETLKPDGKRFKKERSVAVLALENPLAIKLALRFNEMAETFVMDRPEVIPFDGRYTPSSGEMFVIDSFKLDDSVSNALNNVLGTELDLSRSPFPDIKALFAVEKAQPDRVLFQEFKPNQIIRQGRGLIFAGFHSGNVFQELNHPGITVGNTIDAIYDKGRFFFRSYSTAMRFSDMQLYFKDATNEEIKELLKMEGIVADNEAELLENADSVIRRRFTIIKQTDILNRVTADQIKTAATNYGLDIEIDRTGEEPKIVIPSKKAEAKEVLEFLCESRFLGALTNELFHSNSHRPVGKKTAPKKAAAASKKSPAARKTAKKAPAKKKR